MGGIIGLFLATVGIDAMSGAIRFTLDTTYLLGGVSFIPILIGVFALAQMLQSVEDCWQKSQLKQHVTIHKVLPSMADLKRCFVTMLRSSAIGTFIGCIPGTGGDIASFVSYDQAKRWSKHSENFGHGEPEGVAAPEGFYPRTDPGHPRGRGHRHHDGGADGTGPAAGTAAVH